MNTGIQDAVSLAAALRDTMQTGSHAPLDTGPLDTWESTRLAVAKDVVALTDRMTRAATTTSNTAKTLRNALISIAGHLPSARRAIAERLSELIYR